MRTYMAKLGDFMFSLDTAAFQDLERQSQYRWQGVDRIGRKPAQQFLGPAADTITISGVILPTFRGGIGQVGAMRAMAGTGSKLPLVYAFDNVGQYCGDWCIVSIQEKRTVFFDNGAPRHIEFTVQLTEYGGDNDAASASGILAGAIASAGGATIASTNAGLEISTGSLAASAAKAVEAGGSQSQGMDYGERVGVSLSGLSSALRDTRNSAVLTDAGKLLRSTVPGGWALEPMMARLDAAAGSIAAAETPSQMSLALLRGAATARQTYSTAAAISAHTRSSKGRYSGGSPGSLYLSQSENIARAFDGVAVSGQNIAGAATSARVLINV